MKAQLTDDEVYAMGREFGAQHQTPDLEEWPTSNKYLNASRAINIMASVHFGRSGLPDEQIGNFLEGLWDGLLPQKDDD